jgi:diguanylate cyclase (GGDEF)-like protein
MKGMVIFMRLQSVICVEASPPDIRSMIDNGRLEAHFQQIVSVSRKNVVGLEGLIRGIDAETGALIPPMRLFEAAKDDNATLELDRACRETIIGAFSEIQRCDQEKLLFLNLDASVLENAVGSDYLYQQIRQRGINPGNVVIEISEKRVLGNAALKKFVDTYRNYGFMVALDDVGSGYSNMDRILLVKPDIIKIDLSLVKNIHTDFYKQGVFKSLVILSNKIGALVIAEGVETEEEAISVLRLGGHMIQGFFFSTPHRVSAGSGVFVNDKIEFLSRRFNEYMNLQYQQERSKSKRLGRIVGTAVKRLVDRSSEEFDEALRDIVANNPAMECAYVLDHTGVQVSGTVCDNACAKGSENLIFYSARKGTDHSMEKYFYPLMSAKLKKYTTEPYISLATGNLCITVSAVFAGRDNVRFILCADFKTAEESYNIELRVPSVLGLGLKPGMAEILSKMNAEIAKDGLTDSFNRRYLEERLVLDIWSAESTGQPLSVILADIDRFKEVNDKYGHLAGDQVLKDFVELSKGFIRKNTDWIARYGGDEFVIVLPGADSAVAMQAAEKIRLACQLGTVRYGLSHIKFTASFGTNTVTGVKTTVDGLVGTADRNLYAAKNGGKNRVVG